jgi:mRNA interferase RelE/StbE
VQWNEGAIEDLKRLKDKELARKILAKVGEYLAQDPIALGKALTGQFTGLYRYRFGKIRIIYAVDLQSQVLSVLQVGNRKDVYRR